MQKFGRFLFKIVHTQDAEGDVEPERVEDVAVVVEGGQGDQAPDEHQHNQQHAVERVHLSCKN